MYYNYSFLNASCLPIFGGGYSRSASAGAFYLTVTYSAAASDASIGGRLMFL